MPDWPLHLIVPLLALLIVTKREHHQYVLVLLPLAVVSDVDTFFTQHRALLHTMLIPLILLLLGWYFKQHRPIFTIASVYIASHVFMDIFHGGVVFLYPLYHEMVFIDASLQMDQANELIWTFDYGFKQYETGWENAYGYISDSRGTGAMMFVVLAYVCAGYRNWIQRRKWWQRIS